MILPQIQFIVSAWHQGNLKNIIRCSNTENKKVFFTFKFFEVGYKIIFACLLFLLQTLHSKLFAQDTIINSRADELFAYPNANISSFQASYDHISNGDSKFYNTYLLRGFHTFKNNKTHIRLDIPVASANAGSHTITGLDDASVRLSFVLKQHNRTFFGARANLKFPTATEDKLGTGKYIFEPSAGFVHYFKAAKGTFTCGFEYTQSYAGAKDRSNVSALGIVVNADRWFKKGYIGYYPTFRYNFISNTWNIPVDIEGGYMFARNWWLAAEYIAPIVNPKTFNWEFALKLKYVLIRNNR